MRRREEPAVARQLHRSKARIEAGDSRLPRAVGTGAQRGPDRIVRVATRALRMPLPIVELEGAPSGRRARRHAAVIGTFANRLSQYVPDGNTTAAPSCQPARAAA